MQAVLLTIITLQQGIPSCTAVHNAFAAEDICYFVFLRDLYPVLHSRTFQLTVSLRYLLVRLCPHNCKATNQRMRIRKGIR
jgi:hypothetical protein